MIDTFWDLPHTRRMIELYSRVWVHPARRVVNTHHNGDHCWGNQLFPGAEIIGHRKCQEYFFQESPEILNQIRTMIGAPDPVLAGVAEAFDGWDFSGIELHPPNTVFDTQLSLDLEGLQVELIHVGPAHTAGDTILFIPEHRIVFTGDVVFRLCTPIGWEGTYDGWLRAIDRISALDPQQVVPGHGPVCGVEGLLEMGAYLRYVREEATRYFNRGFSAVDAAKRMDLGPYAGWTQPERLVFNVERAYREARGEGFDAPIDTTGLLRAMLEVREAYRQRPPLLSRNAEKSVG